MDECAEGGQIIEVREDGDDFVVTDGGSMDNEGVNVVDCPHRCDLNAVGVVVVHGVGGGNDSRGVAGVFLDLPRERKDRVLCDPEVRYEDVEAC